MRLLIRCESRNWGSQLTELNRRHEDLYLAYHLGRLGVINRFQILLHSSVVVTLLMQVITVLAENHIALSSIDTGLLGKVDSKDIEITLVKNLELLLQCLLVISKELPN